MKGTVAQRQSRVEDFPHPTKNHKCLKGNIMNLPVNPLATALWQKYYRNSDAIVGNIIVTGVVLKKANQPIRQKNKLSL